MGDLGSQFHASIKVEREAGHMHRQTAVTAIACVSQKLTETKNPSNIHISICITGHPGAFEKLVKYLVTYYIYRAISDIRGL